MSRSDVLKRLVEDFVSSLDAVIRQQALEAVQASLMVGGAAKPARAASNGHRNGSNGSTGKGKGAKRPAAELEATQEKFLAFVAKNPGLRIEQINKELGTSTKDLALPIRKLLSSKAIRSEGQKRSTTYFASDGKARAKARKK